MCTLTMGKQNCLRKNTVKKLATVFFAFDVIALIAILVCLWKMEKKLPDCEFICLKNHCQCRADRIDDFLQQTYTEKYAEINERLKKQYKHHKLKHMVEERISGMKPNARIRGMKEDIKEQDENQSGLVPVRSWDTDGNNIFLHNGITYRNGRVVVPFEGLYHVYSYLDMDLNQEENTIPPNKTAIQISIFKSNILNMGKKNEEEELIANFKPYENKQADYINMFDVYVSADVFLHASDELYIKVSDKKYMHYPGHNWFGIHLI